MEILLILHNGPSGNVLPLFKKKKRVLSLTPVDCNNPKFSPL